MPEILSIWLWLDAMLRKGWRVEAYWLERKQTFVLTADLHREHYSFTAPALGAAVAKFRNHWRDTHESQR